MLLFGVFWGSCLRLFLTNIKKYLHLWELLANNHMLLANLEVPVVFLVHFLLGGKLTELSIEVLADQLEIALLNGHVAVDVFVGFLLHLHIF